MYSKHEVFKVIKKTKYDRTNPYFVGQFEILPYFDGKCNIIHQ